MSQKRRFAFTIFGAPDFNLECPETRESFIKRLSSSCSRYVFQLERGEENGTLHYQGRCSFKTAKREGECAKKLGVVGHSRFSIEHDTQASEFYALKDDDTKVDGAWSDKDKPLYIPRQVREIENLHDWQESIIQMANVWDTRHINIIIDEDGNCGKSTLCTYMGVNRLGKLLPFCNDYKDILRMCYDVGVQKAYLIDMPRAISKDRLYQFYGAIETIKSGYCYDDRYKFEDRYFDCPNVFVFSNKLPDLELLSIDRWKLWTIQGLKLVPLKPLECQI